MKYVKREILFLGAEAFGKEGADFEALAHKDPTVRNVRNDNRGPKFADVPFNPS